MPPVNDFSSARVKLTCRLAGVSQTGSSFPDAICPACHLVVLPGGGQARTGDRRNSQPKIWHTEIRRLPDLATTTTEDAGVMHTAITELSGPN